MREPQPDNLPPLARWVERAFVIACLLLAAALGAGGVLLVQAVGGALAR